MLCSVKESKKFAEKSKLPGAGFVPRPSRALKGAKMGERNCLRFERMAGAGFVADSPQQGNRGEKRESNCATE